MKCVVLKSFAYSHDGHNVEFLQADERERDIRDDLVPGLAAAGHVRPITPPQADLVPLTQAPLDQRRRKSR